MNEARKVQKMSRLIKIVLRILVFVFPLIIIFYFVFGILSIAAPNIFIENNLIIKNAKNYSYSVKEYGSILIMNGVTYLIIEIMILLGYSIFKRMSVSTPFEKAIVTKLNIIAFLLITLAFLPSIVQQVIIYLINYNSAFVVTPTAAYVWIALVVYCIAIIFRYGCRIQQKADETIKIQEEVILSFAEISEAKSGETGRHVKRMSEYCCIIAKAIGFDEEKIEEIKYASMMHDVGKLMVPLKILEKKGKLTEKEFDVIKEHVTDGEKLLHNAKGQIMDSAKIIALEHHEKWDGTGYLKLKGDQIHLISRISAVADVFDALTSKRCYKKAWPINKAYDQIVLDSGKHFDPVVVNAFSNSFDKIKETYEKYKD